jgi:hypothetical protein
MNTFNKKTEVSHSSNRSAGDGLLNKAEVAKKLRISPRTLDAWMSAGLVPYLKLGHGRRGTVRFQYRGVLEALRRYQIGGCC